MENEANTTPPRPAAKTLPESVADMPLNVHVLLGGTALPLKEVFKMTVGSIIELSQPGDELAALVANGKVTARGKLVVMKGQYGLKVVSKVTDAKPGR